jgi:hypothetical protein
MRQAGRFPPVAFLSFISCLDQPVQAGQVLPYPRFPDPWIKDLPGLPSLVEPYFYQQEAALFQEGRSFRNKPAV